MKTSAKNMITPRAKVTFFSKICIFALLMCLQQQQMNAQIFHLTTLLQFDGTNGANPGAGLTLGHAGNFYGTTIAGGTNGDGEIFELTSNGILKTLFTFNSTNGSTPYAGLTYGNDGLLYGSTFSGGTNNNGGTLFQFNATNRNLATLVNFDGVNYINGKRPRATLLAGEDGLLYGTTYQGGDGYGTLFNLSTNGDFFTLTNFENSNGAFPIAGLEYGNDSFYYGTTSAGGSNNLGTAFKLGTNGSLTVLATFIGNNGSKPQASLILGPDGNLYGATSEGGQQGWGTIFRMSTNGNITTLVSFDGSNGASPRSALMLGRDGYFYGTTYQGGNTNLNSGLGFGTVFRMTTNGALQTLVVFDSTNGALPSGPLIDGNDGNIYGTTQQGGNLNLNNGLGYGTVFRLSPLPPPPLNISLISDEVVLDWTNSAFSLQTAPTVTGIFTNIPSAVSPYTNPITSQQQYFRLGN